MHKCKCVLTLSHLSEGIPADITSGGDDIATRKCKSTCSEGSGSFCCSVSALCVHILFTVVCPIYIKIYYGNWQARVWQAAFQTVCFSLPSFHYGWGYTQFVCCLSGSGPRSVSSLWRGHSHQCSPWIESCFYWGRAAPKIMGITDGSDRHIGDGHVIFSIFPCQI